MCRNSWKPPIILPTDKQVRMKRPVRIRNNGETYQKLPNLLRSSQHQCPLRLNSCSSPLSSLSIQLFGKHNLPNDGGANLWTSGNGLKRRVEPSRIFNLCKGAESTAWEVLAYITCKKFQRLKFRTEKESDNNVAPEGLALILPLLLTWINFPLTHNHYQY